MNYSRWFLCLALFVITSFSVTLSLADNREANLRAIEAAKKAKQAVQKAQKTQNAVNQAVKAAQTAANQAEEIAYQSYLTGVTHNGNPDRLYSI